MEPLICGNLSQEKKTNMGDPPVATSNPGTHRDKRSAHPGSPSCLLDALEQLGPQSSLPIIPWSLLLRAAGVGGGGEEPDWSMVGPSKRCEASFLENTGHLVKIGTHFDVYPPRELTISCCLTRKYRRAQQYQKCNSGLQDKPRHKRRDRDRITLEGSHQALYGGDLGGRQGSERATLRAQGRPHPGAAWGPPGHMRRPQGLN